jgi:hypothetical protein
MRESKVWVKNGDNYEYKPIRTGLSDGAYVIATEGLNDGDVIVLAASFEKKVKKSGKAASNPLVPQRGGRR